MASETVERDGVSFAVPDREQFERIYADVFGDREYDAGDLGLRPRIIDGGAHVGVATLFFSRRYPGARITAVEGNPATFALLERNIRENGLTGVEVRHAALAPVAGETTYYVDADGSWGDAAVRQPWHDESTRQITVPAISLSSLLNEPVDLLKLDIEGMETAVLAEAAPNLGNARRIVLEFHGSRLTSENRVDRLLATLRGAGFAVEIKQGGVRVGERLIVHHEPYWLAIRAWRPKDVERLTRLKWRWTPSAPPW